MPYIKPELREVWDVAILSLAYVSSTGDLNYIITKICHQYIQSFGLEYKSINEVIGVLECAKLELYRMIAAPYEDGKRKETGSISELDRR